MSTADKQVIIFGATGASGTALAEILSKEHPSWKILATTRSSIKKTTDNPSRLSQMDLPNVEMVQCDSFDRESVLEVSKSCDIIYSCIGFYTYEAKYWAEHWPVVVENLLDATGSSRKLVFCDNIYAYGEGPVVADGERIQPSMNSKPGIRSMLHRRFQEHMQQHPGTVTVIGGADFFGPHVTFTSFLGDASTGKIARGGTPMVIGSAKKVHDFAYLPDLSRAMAIASVNPKAIDKFWICPHSIHGKTMTEILSDIASKAGSRPKKPLVMGKFVISALSPFMGFMKEIKEMLHIWTKDYEVDDTAFIREFGMEATPYDEALQALVDFYQSTK